MPDHEQRMIDAAIDYLALLDASTPTPIGEFVATADPALRTELAAYLEFVLAVGQPGEPLQPTQAEQAICEQVTTRVYSRLQARLQALSPRSLTAARVARKLSSAALARQLDLPVDLLVRIERGGVQAATIPHRLIALLAAALQQAEADIRAMLIAPTPATAGVRLSARSGTVAPLEVAVSFDEAVEASSATPTQRATWRSA
jgi:DNA-binding transcriptional regulator YiaG